MPPSPCTSPPSSFNTADQGRPLAAKSREICRWTHAGRSGSAHVMLRSAAMFMVAACGQVVGRPVSRRGHRWDERAVFTPASLSEQDARQDGHEDRHSGLAPPAPGLFRSAVGWRCRPQPSLRFGSLPDHDLSIDGVTGEPLSRYQRDHPGSLIARRRHPVRQHPDDGGGRGAAVTGTVAGPAHSAAQTAPHGWASPSAHPPRLGVPPGCRGTAPASPTSAPTRRLSPRSAPRPVQVTR